jgi:SPP1 family phage portal protein
VEGGQNLLYVRQLPDIITPDIISDIISYHETYMRPRYKRLKAYYKTHHKIEHREMSDTSKPNNKLIHDYPGYIVNMCVGYFLGKPVAYNSKSSNDSYLSTLQDIFDFNDEADENAEIEKTCSIMGEAFEILFQDEDGKTRFIQVPNDQIIVVYDTTLDPKIKVAVRYYKVLDVNNNTTIKIDVYTAYKISHYTQNGLNYTLDSEEKHYFDEVPVIHYLNNKEQIGDFERVISLIDAYDKQQSNTQNDFDYFTDAYLKIKNMDGTDKEDINQMRENRAIKVGQDGDVEWLVKDMNDAALENYKTRLNKDIHKFSDVPDLSDEAFAGDLSGIAIRFKLFCLEQIASMKERKFKRALQRRIELITNILNIRGGNYIYTDIDMTFTRNIPANLTEIVQMVQGLKGTVSEGTLLAQIPFITDVKAEKDKIKKEQEENPSVNFDTVPPRDAGGEVNGQQPILDEQASADSTQYLQQSGAKESETTAGV